MSVTSKKEAHESEKKIRKQQYTLQQVMMLVVLIALNIAGFAYIIIYSHYRDISIIENMDRNIEEFKNEYHSAYGLIPITDSCSERTFTCDVSFRRPDGSIVVYTAYCSENSCSGELPIQTAPPLRSNNNPAHRSNGSSVHRSNNNSIPHSNHPLPSSNYNFRARFRGM